MCRLWNWYDKSTKMPLLCCVLMPLQDIEVNGCIYSKILKSVKLVSKKLTINPNYNTHGEWEKKPVMHVLPKREKKHTLCGILSCFPKFIWFLSLSLSLQVLLNLLYFYGMCGVLKECLLQRYFSKVLHTTTLGLIFFSASGKVRHFTTLP